MLQTQDRKLTQTERVLIDMLKENTGRHMLDSGGAYGRHFEHNQAREFLSESDRELSFKYGYIDLTLNLFHFLAERLEYAESMQADFIQWDSQVDPDRDISWFEQIPVYLEYLANERGREVLGGIYADSDNFLTVNTYNEESLLSQVIQWTLVHIDDSAYYILQIHNGCDVRGGYTAPVFFYGAGGSEPELALFDHMQSSIDCKDDDTYSHNWYTDDSYHYYEDGSTAGHELQEYEFIDLESIDMLGYGRAWAHIQAFKAREGLQPAALYYDSETGIGYCPLCGGELH